MGEAQGPREAPGLGSHIHSPGGRGEDGEADTSPCWGRGRQHEAGSQAGQGRRRLVSAGVGTPPGGLPTCGPGESEGQNPLLELSSSLNVGTSSSPRKRGAPAPSSFWLWLVANLPFLSTHRDPSGLNMSPVILPVPTEASEAHQRNSVLRPQSLGDISTHCRWLLAFDGHISFAQF